MFPEGFEWRNEFAARAALRTGVYSPVRRAGGIIAPLLVCLATADAVTPPDAARRAAVRAPRGELREYPGGHFDIYVGETFERAVADQVGFLARHL
jgi:alpha-beta hydrolase superfamily lysophospholipase